MGGAGGAHLLVVAAVVVEADDGGVVAAGDVGAVARLGVDELVDAAALDASHVCRVFSDAGMSRRVCCE